MGTRFLAVLAVMALGASSALVGLTMASGQWTTVGEGLEPGKAYAVQLTDQADRLRLELLNGGEGATASFSVYAPGGQRAGYYVLDHSTKQVEVVAGKGVWTLFVYKAQGGDLTVGVHGPTNAGRFLEAEVERREFTLGNVRGTQAVENTYTAIVREEPVLANVILEGSARNLVSELRTEKGVVEVVSEQETSAVQGGAIVDSRGERVTFPQHLAAGPFTARVQAESLAGTLKLVVLYVDAPTFDAPEVEDEREREHHHEHEEAPEPPRHRPPREHKHHTPKAPPARPAMMAEWQECGTATDRDAFALDVERGGALLRVTLGEPIDPWVTIFTPQDTVLAVVQLEKEGEEAVVPLPMRGEYVLYSRGMDVEVALLGVSGCSLRELDIEAVAVAAVGGRLDRTEEEVAFALATPPLEFGLRMADPLAVGLDVRATFTGPAGEAATYEQSFNSGLFGGGLPLPFGGGHREGRGSHRAYAEVDAEKLLEGEWTLQVDADLLEGDLEAFALHYLRASAEKDDN